MVDDARIPPNVPSTADAALIAAANRVHQALILLATAQNMLHGAGADEDTVVASVSARYTALKFSRLIDADVSRRGF
ncbi:MAG: hypothetical protein EOP64_00140 [Sphingomonas sp.]|nr:MAG: hypothetical protein EOP64_00140 [Sphingomonas sp.]